MHSELRNSGALTTPIGIRTTNLSRRLSSSNQLSGLLASSGSKDHRLNSSHADCNADSDHARITMKTRVAVRDNTPHRFQVVPLRDASKLAAFGGGRPSQLALPPAPHTLLRSASIRRQTYSQVRPVIASSDSQVDLNTRDNKVVYLAESETLATPCAELLAMPVFALSPSFELETLEGSHALAEQDMNRQYTKPTTHKFESSITTPTKVPRTCDASHHHTQTQNFSAVFSNRGPSAHTTSQSLDIVSCTSGTHPKKFKRNAPEYFIGTTQSAVMDSKSPRKKRTRSENIPSTRDNNQRDGRNDPAAAVITKEKYDSRMTKRHAIYTQSLYVPFLEPPSHIPGSSIRNQKAAHPNETVSDSHHLGGISFSQMSQTFVSDDSGITKTNSDDYKDFSRCLLQDIVEVAASEQSLQLLKPHASASAPHTGPHRGLKYHRLSRVYPLSAEARSHIIYPQIIHEMFTDIDRAIQEWRHI